jgi:uncharacterized membrane protein
MAYRSFVQRYLAIFILVLAISQLAVPVMTLAASTLPAEPPVQKGEIFRPELPLPGVFEGDQTVDSTLMSRYIRAVYIYFVWVVGIIATVMVIYGSIKWVAAAGNPSQINDARDAINSAIIGVVIALGSVVLLNVINPKLTELNLPGIKKVGTEDLAGPLTYKDADGNCYPSNKIPCGLSCYNSVKNQKVIGDCSYCTYPSKPTAETLCGTMSQDPEVLASKGNCLFTGCLKPAAEACTYVANSFGATMGLYSCTASTTLPDLSPYGFTTGTMQYNSSYDCGTIWFERKVGGLIGLGTHEEIRTGTRCPMSGAAQQWCLINRDPGIEINVKKAAIPAGDNSAKIGQWKSSWCK